MQAPPSPIDVLGSLFDPDTARGFADAARRAGGDAEARLARAAEEAAWWGEEDRFEAFLERYRPVIRRVCSWENTDQGEARSRCEESLLRTWRKVGRGTKPRPLPVPFGDELPYEAFVAKYAQTSNREELRLESRQDQKTPPHDHDGAMQSVADAADNFAVVDRRAELWLARLTLMAELQDLPADQRDVVIVRVTEWFDSGLRLESTAIAAMLDKTPNAVDTSYSRARKALRERGIDLAALEDACRASTRGARK